MARKKSKHKKGEGFISALQKETLEGISAIVFILVAIFLFLAPFGKAGFLGNITHSALQFLFGIGYYLIPIILIILGASFIKSLSHNLAWPKLIGGVLMFLTGLGLIDLLVSQGGVTGALLNAPLLGLFGMWMTYIIHFALMIISILVIFDLSLTTPILEGIFSRKNRLESEENSDEDENWKDDYYEEDYEEDTDDGKSKKDADDSEDEASARAALKIEEEKKRLAEAAAKNTASEKKSSGLVFLSRRSDEEVEYKAPPLSMLERDSGKPGTGDIKVNANIIRRTLANFGIQVEMDEVSIGPSVTRYALKPAQGVKLSRIVALQNDLSLALAAKSIRIEAPIPGKSLVGIEIPNSTKTRIGLGSILKDDAFQKSPNPLTFGVGRGVTGASYFANLAKMPHLLVAGATGAGKSVTIHAIITSLLYRNSPEMLKFIMVDPKRVELTMYNGIPHLLTPVITDAKKTILALKWAAKEMSRRYDILESCGVRDISSYHKKTNSTEKMPYIVIVVDELADIMQTYPRELEAGVVRLAQMSRAVGIHLIISTQRPSVNVITGLIKANIPARIALQVSSQIDSRTILDAQGAEKLLGAGDMLYIGEGIGQPVRIQSPFISEDEVKNVVSFLKKYNAGFENSESGSDNGEIDLEKVANNRSEIFDSLNADGVGGGNGRGAGGRGAGGRGAGGEMNDDISDGLGGDFDDEEDDLYDEAKEIVISAGKASTSYLQRKLRIGYSRAARIMDILEDRGIIGPADGSKPRQVLADGGDGGDASGREGDNYEEGGVDQDEGGRGERSRDEGSGDEGSGDEVDQDENDGDEDDSYEYGPDEK